MILILAHFYNTVSSDNMVAVQKLLLVMLNVNKKNTTYSATNSLKTNLAFLLFKLLGHKTLDYLLKTLSSG